MAVAVANLRYSWPWGTKALILARIQLSLAEPYPHVDAQPAFGRSLRIPFSVLSS